MTTKQYKNQYGTITLLRQAGIYQITADIADEIHIYKTTERDSAYTEYEKLLQRLKNVYVSGSPYVPSTKHLS